MTCVTKILAFAPRHESVKQQFGRDSNKMRGDDGESSDKARFPLQLPDSLFVRGVSPFERPYGTDSWSWHKQMCCG